MADSYTYTNTTEELQNAADVGVAIHGTNGLIKSDGAGNITAATAGTDYVIPSAVPSIPTTSNLVKGDGAGALVAATPNTDYVTPAGLPVVVNPNLLDNAYFVGGGSQQGGCQFPINQNGNTSYTSVGYTIDRWYDSNGVSVAVNADYITLTSRDSSDRTIFQALSPANAIPSGAPYTVSILTDTGLFSATATMPNTAICYPTGASGNWTCFYQPSSNSFRLYAKNTAGALNVKAIKLELGSKQTLAHQESGVWVLNEIPDYAAEVAKCNPVVPHLFILQANVSVAFSAYTAQYSSVEHIITAIQLSGNSFTVTITPPTG